MKPERELGAAARRLPAQLGPKRQRAAGPVAGARRRRRPVGRLDGRSSRHRFLASCSPTRARNASSRRRRGTTRSTPTPALHQRGHHLAARRAVDVHHQARRPSGRSDRAARRPARPAPPGAASTSDTSSCTVGESPTISSTGPDATTSPLCMTTTCGAGLLHLGEQVAGDQHGPAVGGVPPQHPAHLGDLRRVEPVGRLVEHQQLRQAEHRLGDGQPLLHAVAVRADLAVDRRRRARRSPAPRRSARRSAGRPVARQYSSQVRPARSGAAGSPAPRPARRAGTAPARRAPAGARRRAPRRRSAGSAPSAPAAWWSCRRRSGPSRPTTCPRWTVKSTVGHRDEPVGVLLAQPADDQRGVRVLGDDRAVGAAVPAARDDDDHREPDRHHDRADRRARTARSTSRLADRLAGHRGQA